MYYPNQNFDYQQKMRDVVSGAFNPYTQIPMQPMNPICNNVTSFDEVRSFRIDPMNTYIFVDEPNNKIYKKRIGAMGAAEIHAYSLDNPPTPVSNEERISLLEKRMDEKLLVLEKIAADLSKNREVPNE